PNDMSHSSDIRGRVSSHMRMLSISLFLTFALGLALQAQRNQTVKVDVDRVLVYTTVTDAEGRYVTGLKPEHFQVFEDKVAQKIETVSVEDVPLSVGIILDASGSMKTGLSVAKEAAVMFLKMGNPSDEYFLVEFNDSAKVTEDFTTDITKLQNHLVFLPAKGRTSLFDGVYLGFQKVQEGTNPRKFLLVLTDGQENHSRYNFFQLRDFAREHDVQIYAIGGRGRAEDSLVVRGGTFG